MSFSPLVQSSHDEGSQDEGSRRTVLIVDDHADSLFYAQQAVELFGYSAITLSEGQQTIEAAKSCLPDVILLDICLVNSNGFDIIAQLKETEATGRIYVIAVTAMIRKTTRDHAIAAGFDDFLSKPYTLDELDCKLKRFAEHLRTDSASSTSASSTSARSTSANSTRLPTIATNASSEEKVA